jgi:phosphoglycolate phosphatase
MERFKRGVAKRSFATLRMTGRLIVFDVDGTILNSQAMGDRIVLEYSRAQGLPDPDLEEIRHGYGDPYAHDFGWGVSREEQVRHMRASWALVDECSLSGKPEHTPALFAGVPETLLLLKNTGHTLAIITSKPEAPLLHLLDMHNVRHFFATHRAVDDVHRRKEREKPQPDMLQSVMRELKFTPKDTVMIGDTTMDIRMGRSADTHTIGVTWGAHPKEHLQQAGAHHIVETKVDDIVHTIKVIFK